MDANTPVAERAFARDVVAEDGLARTAGTVLVVALVIIFLWFGALKFTEYEESGVAGFIMNNPLIAWLHGAFGVAGGAQFLGVYEILTGILIAARLFSARLGAIGGAMGMIAFLLTITCLFTTPGVIQPGFDGPFALSAVPGQFLLKDIGLFAACFWIMATARAEAQARKRLS